MGGEEPDPAKAAPAFEGAGAGCFAVAAHPGDAYTYLIRPADDVYVDEPYLSIRWDSGLGKLTVEDVSELVDHHELQSRTFDSMSAARQWVSEASPSL